MVPSEAVVLAAVTLGTMLAPLNSTMIAVALPAITLTAVARQRVGERGYVQARVARFARDERPGPTERAVPGYTTPAATTDATDTPDATDEPAPAPAGQPCCRSRTVSPGACARHPIF